MKDVNQCVIGGGWAGLLVARKLMQSGARDITVIEASKRNELGGLLKSVVIDGFTFDSGGPHLLFSRNERILSDITGFLKPNLIKMIRNNFVHYKGKFIPYPFENGIYQLDAEERVRIITGIIQRMLFNAQNEDWVPHHFLDWMTGFFGDEMANEYLIPYNKKIWKRPLDKIAVDWVFTPGRLPFPELENMLLTVAGIPNIGYKEQLYFYYPKIGGIASLYNALLDEISLNGTKIVTDEKIVSVKINPDKTFTVNNKIKANKLISTIPLPELLMSLEDGNNYKELARKFDYNNVIVIGIAIRGKTPTQTTVYVPNPNIVFHRYTWMSALVPPENPDCSNLIAEITVPKDKIVDLRNIERKVIKGLLDLKVINDENSILFTQIWFNKYGYPIYSLDHNEIREKAMRIFAKHNIKSVGRWGSWQYWNTDMVYKGVEELNLFK